MTGNKKDKQKGMESKKRKRGSEEEEEKIKVCRQRTTGFNKNVYESYKLVCKICNEDITNQKDHFLKNCNGLPGKNKDTLRVKKGVQLRHGEVGTASPA